MRGDQKTMPSSEHRLVYVPMLFTAAFIFGFSFMVMKPASTHLSAFTFNGLTWLLGSLVVLPLTRRKRSSVNGQRVLKNGTTIYYLIAGLIFVGFGSLMEVHGIQNLPPSVGAVVLSLESVSAVLTSWLVLGETMSHQALLSCALIFSAIFIAQFQDAGARSKDRAAPNNE